MFDNELGLGLVKDLGLSFGECRGLGIVLIFGLSCVSYFCLYYVLGLC